VDEDDTMSISIDTEKRRLHLEGGGQSFSLMLVDPDSIQQMPGVEDLSFSALAIIEQQWLKTHINAADELADYTTLDVDGSTITVEASSDISDYSGTLTEADNSTIKIDSAGAFRSCYSLKYLTDMVRPAPKTTPVTIRFAPETPLSMGFELAEGEVEVNYYLAPRVSNDDSTNAETEDLGDGQTDSTSPENVSTDSSATADD
jgi:proliferating cell nuclear antigen